jgi:VacB/RNase II family 3'-5' exoribonuclease
MLERGLLPDFSAAAVTETKALTQAATEASGSVRDLRKLLWASIDNDDSKDLDQLSVAVPAAGGAVRILVAVADVDAMVERDSAIDAHAKANTTSVYTAGQVFPMLPEKLSTDLTSLGQDQERLALVVDMSVRGDGTVGESDVYRAVVVNRAKLAYNSVAAWLEGAAAAPALVLAVPGLDEQLRIQDRAAQAMKDLRHQHGALSLETLEAHPVFEGDVLTGLQPDAKNRARQLIEDFMVAANGVTARFLQRRGLPQLRRVLRSPERWERLVELAASRQAHLPGEPDAAALEAFLSKQRELDPLRFPDLSLATVKLLGRGEYALALPSEGTQGHFGLAVRDYTHSTAPNRRFPDVITQRLLKSALAGEALPYTTAELSELARHCTEQEDRATKVERQVRKSAAALLLESRVGERFQAIVTGASDKGTWVRTLEPPVEGKVVRGFRGLDVGAQVKVELVETDVERGFVDFARVNAS